MRIFSFDEGLTGEYASADDLYVNKKPVVPPKPVYANVTRNTEPTSQYGHANADGCRTPTNQDNGGSLVYDKCHSLYGERDMHQMQVKLRNNKPTPPKPPVRHSSCLTNPEIVHPKTNKGTTRIYVVPSDNKLPDLPPPPPEAYVNYESADSQCQSNGYHHESTAKQVPPPPPPRNSSEYGRAPTTHECCEYSFSQPKLVLCNDVNCLQGLSSAGYHSTVAYSPTDPNHQAFAFETNFARSLNSHKENNVAPAD